ncbi:ABC transporter ATP-binding protein [Bacillus sp. DNRA2]|uniref:ABC transporter ATP-binding protein n=1 Tax=Bacillus sp. DNRA2 TaxID=2723053 RepID=UPI00145DEB60|nr:ABC transporter ATP-binding protein [Bacillus sp. DNRA2]NMD69988.1 ABC transporter ATP-binding protein [Bacillus sp. DNRA2]
MPVITVNGLKKSFQDKEVIKGLDFILQTGKCTALIGPNGAGKTTILRMLSGLIQPSAGTIKFHEDHTKGDIRQYIGYLPQFPVFHDWMTGIEFLQFVGRLAGLTKSVALQRAKELLALVGLEEAKNRRIGKYSGGMKQRLGIAQAIIHRPKLVMLDEPVSALDPFGRREVLELLEKLKQETTILFSTHILNDAEEVCDQILFLHNGELVETGTMSELQLKYQQAKLLLEFTENAATYIDAFTKQELIEKRQIDGNQATLFVKDLEKTKAAMLREIADDNWPLLRFEVGRLTLEDVFLEVVKK